MYDRDLKDSKNLVANQKGLVIGLHVDPSLNIKTQVKNATVALGIEAKTLSVAVHGMGIPTTSITKS